MQSGMSLYWGNLHLNPTEKTVQPAQPAPLNFPPNAKCVLLPTRGHHVQFSNGLLRPRLQEMVHSHKVFRRLWWRHPGQTPERAGCDQNQQGQRGSTEETWTDIIEFKINVCVCVSLCRTQAKSQAGWKSSRTIIQISLFEILRWGSPFSTFVFLSFPVCVQHNCIFRYYKALKEVR